MVLSMAHFLADTGWNLSVRQISRCSKLDYTDGEIRVMESAALSRKKPALRLFIP
jgi:hypothetical protein